MERHDDVIEDIFFAFCLALALVIALGFLESEFTEKSDKAFSTELDGKPLVVEKRAKLSQLLTSPRKRFYQNEIDKGRAQLIEGVNVSQVYHIYDNHDVISYIFKPFETISSYEGSLILSTKGHILNEIAAYKFDQLAEYKAGVPETRLAKLPGRFFNAETAINGSLQRFVKNGENCEDFGSSLFSVDDIHRIGLLDLKILNCDRHTGNLLFDSRHKQLYPIDHALSFPELSLKLDESETKTANLNEAVLNLGHISFDWLWFNQSKMPFSSELKSDIENINITAYLHEMKAMKMTLKQQLAIFCSLVIVKKSVTVFDKTLFDIGGMIQRVGDRKSPSVFELLVHKSLCDCGINDERDLAREALAFKRVFTRRVHEYLLCTEQL